MGLKSRLLIIIYILASLLTYVHTSSSVANFPVLPDMKSGEHKLTLSTIVGPSQKQYGQSYRASAEFSGTFPTVPYVAIGLLTFEAQPSNNSVDFYVEIVEIGVQNFKSHLTVREGTTINELRYMYLAFEKEGNNYGHIYDIMQYVNLTDFDGTLNTQIERIHSENDTYDPTHKHIFRTFLMSFTIEQQNNEYSVKVQSSLQSSQQFKTIVSSNSTLTAVNFFVIHIDETALTQSFLYYIDVGHNFGANNQFIEAKFDAPISSFNYYNYISGANWLSFETQPVLSANFNGNPDPLSSLGTYNYANSNLLHWRKRQCLTYPYYTEGLQKCFDNCPIRYANVDVTNKYCQKCHYSCLNCESDGTTCIQCSPSNTTGSLDDANRQLDNGTCLCIDGYYDPGVEKCQICDYTCLTCLSSSTFCSTCRETRELTNNSCPCAQRRFEPQQNSTLCELCHYTCQSCEEQSTKCISCSLNSNRQLTNDNRCLCSSGFSATEGVQICTKDATLQCDFTCKTCEGNSQNCTTCQDGVNRVFNQTSNKCSCIEGYQSVNNTLKCTEICGDSKRYEDECDDGNIVDGDGCSSSCTIQDNYDCDNTTQPSICVFRQGYNIKVLSIKKDSTSNTVILVFKIQPAPPASSKPTIEITYSSQTPVSDSKMSHANLVTIDYVLNGQDLVMSLKYTESIPEFTFARLSLGDTVGESQQFQVQTDDGTALNFYNETQYSLYNIELILIWLLIGITWLGAIISIIADKSSILKLVELFMSIGITWVGSQGLYRYLIYYEPLLNLKYIFGYNETVTGEDGLLAYVNYCLILNIAPLLIFFILFVVNKIKQFPLTQLTKKFFLIQLTYAWLCFNSVIVIYGLFTQSFTQTFSTPLSIGSLVVGIFYLLILLLMSIYMAWDQKSFVFFKSQMNVTGRNGPLFFFIHMMVIHLSCIVLYLLLGYFVAVARNYIPLIFVGLALITIVIAVILKPYTSLIRVLFNQILQLLIFLSYFLIKQVENAEWGGFAILVLLYIQVIGNFFSIGLSAKQNLKKYEGEDDDDDDDDYELDEYMVKQMMEDNLGVGEGEIGDFRFIDPRMDQQMTSVKKNAQSSPIKDHFDGQSSLRRKFELQDGI